MNVGSQKGDVSPRHIAIIAAGQAHGFASSDKNCFVVADVPCALSPELTRLPEFITLDNALIQYVNFLHEHLINSGSNNGPFNKSSERQMLLLLMQLLQERYGEKQALDRRITAARDYVDQYFYQAISLAQLSVVANISTRQLSTLFRQQLGMTPQQYLTQQRMQYALEQLETSTLSIQKIADQSGYSNLSSFSDRFHKHFGYPPSYFRKMSK